MGENKTIEREAANALQGKKGIKFKIVLFGWLKVQLRFKYVQASTLISIGTQQSYMAKVDKDSPVDVFVIQNAKDMKRVSRMVALACLNGPVLNFFFSRFLAMILRWSSMDATEWRALNSLLRLHVNPEVFFYTMVSTQGLNLLRKSETSTEGEKPSSAQ
jgi:hypothetical protein